jgi:VWFA-related protein
LGVTICFINLTANPRRLAAIFVCCLTFLLSPHLTIAQQFPGPAPSPPPPPPSDYRIEVNVNSVLVPVVVRDARGHAVGNLKKEDFQILDQDKPRQISGFTIQQRAPTEGDAPPAAPATPVSEAPSAPSAPQPPAPPERFIIFLFDDMHLSASDLSLVQKAASKMLAESLADSDRASVISIFGRADSGVTNDRAKLEDAIAKLQLRNPYRHTGQECPDVDLYHADRIENRNDRAALEVAIEDALVCAHLDPIMRNVAEAMAHQEARTTLSMGEQDVRITLIFIRELVRKMAGLPGQRTLILISPGFFTVTPEAMALQSQVIEMAARSNVTISTMDARGLYTTGLDATQEALGPARETRLKAQSHVESMERTEDVMADIADATGGTFIHNSNDLEGGLKRLAAAPEYVYLLEFSLNNVKLDGAYHHLKVKVDRDDLKLQARRGYFAPKLQKGK